MPMPEGGEGCTVNRGPRPGLLSEVVRLHGAHYARRWNFPFSFERKVADEMAAFLRRYDPARDVILWLESDDPVVASITIDGSDPALAPAQAHLRWFIADQALQGRGFGGRLLEDAVAFARRAAFGTIYLTTFRGLDRAATLYRRAGFRLIDEREGDRWGARV